MEMTGSVMKHLRGFLTPSEINKIIKHATRKRDKLIMRTLWNTGARIGEIVGIRKADAVDNQDHLEIALTPSKLFLSENKIFLHTIKRTKGDDDGGRAYNFGERLLQVPKRLLIDLTNYSSENKINEEEPIFPISRQRVFQITKEAGLKAKISPKSNEKFIHPHHFRHSHAVQFIRHQGGIDGLKRLQGRLDHRNLMTTTVYLQFSQAVDQEDIEDMFG